jgi:hypothetical protein
MKKLERDKIVAILQIIHAEMKIREEECGEIKEEDEWAEGYSEGKEEGIHGCIQLLEDNLQEVLEEKLDTELLEKINKALKDES